jgi:hypothetical protein
MMASKLSILYYFAETNSYMHQWQRVHFIDELERAGHKLTIFNPLLYESIEKANEILPVFITESSLKFDVFINPSPSSVLFGQTVQRIKKIGLPTLLICFDNLHAPFLHVDIAPLFDLVWLTSSETEYLFKKWGCSTVFQPYAANPFLFRPEYGKEILTVGFIGTLYDDRVQRINRLTENSVPCTLYSSSVARTGNTQPGNKLSPREVISLIGKLSQFKLGRKVAYGRIMNKFLAHRNQLVQGKFLEVLPSVPFEEVNAIYSNHALSLNITELRNTFNLKHPVHKLHLRTFEIAMSGGLQIAPHVEELASYFKDGEEIVLCRNDEEFVSKSLFYLRPQNESLRMKMKQNARRRAEADHTWNNRFNVVFGKLFGSS